MSERFEYSRPKCVLAGFSLPLLYAVLAWVIRPFLPGDEWFSDSFLGMVLTFSFLGLSFPVLLLATYLGGLSAIVLDKDGVSGEHLIFPGRRIRGDTEHLVARPRGGDSWVFSFNQGKFAGVDTGHDDVGGGSGELVFYGSLATDEAKMRMSDFLSSTRKRRS